jgi:Arc/MetJ family transcription regulator
MRTTLDIDDALMEALMDRHPGAAKTEVIEEAVRAYLRADSVTRLLELAGTMEIEDVSADLRAHDRHT